LIAGLASGSIATQLVTTLALVVASVATLALIALWRKPLRPSLHSSEPPALRYSRATHHAGHIVATFVANPQRVSKLSLTDRCHLPSQPAAGQTHSNLRQDLGVALAGLTAEEIFTGESGTNVADDLAIATELGSDMVGRFGMTGSLVSLATGRIRRSAFLMRVIDDPRTRKELEALLRDAKRETMRVMLENRHLIVAVRDALLRDNELAASDIHRILDEAQERRRSDDHVLVDLRAASDRPRPLLGIAER
jgi:ATP-dependent Zn protease